MPRRREDARRASRPFDRGWGGVTIAYRRRLIDTPSYTLNHEEVAKAMEEGIRFAEGMTPVAVEVDQYDRATGLRLLRASGDGPANEEVSLPARTILVAAGTQPNTVLAREDPAHVELDGRYFQALDEDGNKVSPQRVAKPDQTQVLMHLGADGRAVSFFGDLHPSFAGNVVKAMGGAKRGYPVVSRVLARRMAAGLAPEALKARLDDELRATVHEVIPPDAEDRSRSSCAPRWRRGRSSPASSTAYRITRPMPQRVDWPRRSRWRAPGADRRVDRPRSGICCRRSCSRWAARPTFAPSWSRVSR